MSTLIHDTDSTARIHLYRSLDSVYTSITFYEIAINNNSIYLYYNLYAASDNLVYYAKNTTNIKLYINDQSTTIYDKTNTTQSDGGYSTSYNYADAISTSTTIQKIKMEVTVNGYGYDYKGFGFYGPGNLLQIRNNSFTASITFNLTYINNNDIIVCKNNNVSIISDLASTYTTNYNIDNSIRNNQIYAILPQNPIKDKIIYIKSVNKDVRLYAWSGHTIEQDRYTFTSNNITISRIYLHKNAAITLTYDGTTWRILSYYNGSLAGNITRVASASGSYTNINKSICISNSFTTGNKYIALPNPAATPSNIITVIQGAGRQHNLYVSGPSMAAIDNVNGVILLNKFSNWSYSNAAIRFITDGSFWYILDIFDRVWETITSNGGTVASRNIAPDKSIIYVNTTSTERPSGIQGNAVPILSVNVPDMSGFADDTYILQHIKGTNNTATEKSIVLKSSNESGKTGPLFASTDRYSAYNPATRKMPAIILVSHKSVGGREYYVAGEYIGY